MKYIWNWIFYSHTFFNCFPHQPATKQGQNESKKKQNLFYTFYFSSTHFYLKHVLCGIFIASVNALKYKLELHKEWEYFSPICWKVGFCNSQKKLVKASIAKFAKKETAFLYSKVLLQHKQLKLTLNNSRIFLKVFHWNGKHEKAADTNNK